MNVTVDEIKTTSWIFRIWSHPVGARRTQLHASCVITTDEKDPEKCGFEILNIPNTDVISMREVRVELHKQVKKLGFTDYSSNRSYNAQMIERKIED